MDFLDSKDVALIGRKQNAVALKYDKSIVISTDILKWSSNTKKEDREPSISLDDLSSKIEVFATDILLEAKGSQHVDESTVYGESLVELLRWIITVLKTHSHPPNNVAIPDFHVEADRRHKNMDIDLLNKHVRTI